jgi:hypothetical protein
VAAALLLIVQVSVSMAADEAAAPATGATELTVVWAPNLIGGASA